MSVQTKPRLPYGLFAEPTSDGEHPERGIVQLLVQRVAAHNGEVDAALQVLQPGRPE